MKVQFFWDREGKKDAGSSCWVRVGQLWAGKRWGASFWPRIGQEVIVAFLEGNPDAPIIVGSVYNAEQMPPYLGDGLDSKHPKDNKVDRRQEQYDARRPRLQRMAFRRYQGQGAILHPRPEQHGHARGRQQP